MKKFIKMFATVLAVCLIATACGSGTDQSSATDTSNKTIPMPAPDNSSATNPSLADTAFSKGGDSMSAKDADTAKPK